MKKNIAIKGAIVAVLTLLLLIPTAFINGLISERQFRQHEAFTEISSKWAEAQVLTGPIVSIPYLDFYRDKSGINRERKNYLHILPERLTISGEVNPEKRYRGIFETVVYTSKLNFNGSFSGLKDGNKAIPTENILFDQAFVSLGITDLRGIEEAITLKWNNEHSTFNSGIETNDVLSSGVYSPIKIDLKDSSDQTVEFSFEISLKGSQSVYFTPVGKETNVSIHSNWPTPSFDGAFLPDKRDINEKGFNAEWKVLHLNRNYPQTWINNRFNVGESAFGINLILPIDGYTKTDRSIKYALLFIGLTFLIFYFLELLNNKQVHPLQYLLIGFALCIFYILLLSISEHIHFNLAYLIASVMTIGLIWWYSRSVLADKKLATLVGGNLVILYGFIFTIIQLEDYALLMGSLGLFIILTIVMYYSKKIEWNEIGK